MPLRNWFAKQGEEGLGQIVLANDGSELGNIVDQFEIGDRCLTVRAVTVREEEDVQSDSVTSLRVGTMMLVTEVGAAGHAVKVLGCGFEGWVPCAMPHGWQKPIILLPNGRSVACCEGVGHILARFFKVGQDYTVNSAVTVRSGESLQSNVVGNELTPGTTVSILRLSTANRRRARIRAGSVEGWLSLVTPEGDLLVNAESCAPPVGFDLRTHIRQRKAVTCTYDETLCAKTQLEEDLAFAIIADFQLRVHERGAKALKLKTFEFGCGNCAAETKFEATCSICLDDFSKADKVKELPCGHIFHAPCVELWFQKSDVCPLRCRARIVSL